MLEGKFSIVSLEDVDEHWIEGKEGYVFHAVADLLKCLDEWDMHDFEAIDGFYHCQIMEALQDIMKKIADNPREVIEHRHVFDMDMSGVIIRWTPEEE